VDTEAISTHTAPLRGRVLGQVAQLCSAILACPQTARRPSLPALSL